jgi:hypothetical protein
MVFWGNQVYPGIMMVFFGGNLGNLGSILTGKHHRTMVPLGISGRFDWVYSPANTCWVSIRVVIDLVELPRKIHGR